MVELLAFRGVRRTLGDEAGVGGDEDRCLTSLPEVYAKEAHAGWNSRGNDCCLY